ncbi:MAG: hypothetical protein NTX66_00145 [Candidatus Falkowbacteria bacterium]|nr:hypothetical protein [Candidatus Falkowbacteria bacterium]
MLDQLKKAIKLIKKTGDKIVFFDSQEPENTVVLVDLDSYEKMVLGGEIADNKLVYKKTLTDEDLTDKINREILIWKNQENSRFLEEENKARKGWQIPPEVKSGAKEIE